jgi:hypothetical protein
MTDWTFDSNSDYIDDLQQASDRLLQLLIQHHGPENRYDIPPKLQESLTRRGTRRIPWRPSMPGGSG